MRRTHTKTPSAPQAEGVFSFSNTGRACIYNTQAVGTGKPACPIPQNEKELKPNAQDEGNSLLSSRVIILIMDRRLFLKGALATGALSLGGRGLIAPGTALGARNDDGQAKLL